MTDRMKISIVMPSFNQGKYVEAAICSVLDQDYPDKELLFLDGGSTDETMAIVERYKDRFAYCVSGYDNGQSDALHRGFLRASGDVLTWLNTDDLLLPGALREVAVTFATSPPVDCVFGNTVWIDAGGMVLKCRRGEQYHNFLPKFGRLPVYGPSAFFRRELYQRCVGLSLNLHYLMDTDLWWRFVSVGAKFRRAKTYTWALRLHDAAKTSAPLYATQPSEALQNSMAARAREVQRVSALIKTMSLPGSKYLGPALHALVRLFSLTYLQGHYEDHHWKGHSIDEFVASYSPRAFEDLSP
jgi:glycosyltransferase involved in cell wall biosynthesis